MLRQNMLWLRSAPVALFIAVACCAAQSRSDNDKAREEQMSYVLGADDLIAIRILQAPEIAEKPVRIDLDGKIELPYIGQVRAAGLTLEQLRDDLKARLKTIIREPELAITIEEFRSQPVSVIGAVNTPGIHQIRGRKTLVEILSMAGGLRTDAGSTLTITRRVEWGSIELPSAKLDASGRFRVATVNLRALLEARNPEQNIAVMPNDIISVAPAQMIYVLGEVQKAGAFVLNDREDVFLLEALSLAGGVNRTAAPQNAKILRRSAGRTTQMIPVNLRKVMEGKAEDIALHAQDVLFVPGSASKRASVRALEAALQIGTGVAVFRR